MIQYTAWVYNGLIFSMYNQKDSLNQRLFILALGVPAAAQLLMAPLRSRRALGSYSSQSSVLLPPSHPDGLFSTGSSLTSLVISIAPPPAVGYRLHPSRKSTWGRSSGYVSIISAGAIAPPITACAQPSSICLCTSYPSTMPPFHTPAACHATDPTHQ